MYKVPIHRKYRSHFAPNYLYSIIYQSFRQFLGLYIRYSSRIYKIKSPISPSSFLSHPSYFPFSYFIPLYFRIHFPLSLHTSAPLVVSHFSSLVTSHFISPYRFALHPPCRFTLPCSHHLHNSSSTTLFPQSILSILSILLTHVYKDH